MTIKKYLHSCILLEKNGKRLLIDPGSFSFIEGKLKPEDIEAVDVVLVTHSHPDHCYPEALKVILQKNSATVLAHPEIVKVLNDAGISAEAMQAGEARAVAGFTIQALSAPHGGLPIQLPANLAFLVDDVFLHPGDSFAVTPLQGMKVLALPTFAPWATLGDSIAFAERIRPKIAIPIHDAFVKDFMLERMYGYLVEPKLKEGGIEFRNLKLGETLEF